MELAKAQSMLAFIGLATPPHPDLGPPAVPPGQAPGTVQSSSPAAGTQLAPGSPVRLMVFGVPTAPVVPSVHGLDVGVARGMLASAGFSPADTTIGTQAPDEALAGKVQTTSPGPGTPAEAGSPVMLIVYAGRPPVTEAQQAAGDCSRFPGATAQYDHRQGKVLCRCPDGSLASSQAGGCRSSTTADTTHTSGPKSSVGKLEVDCSLYPGSRPVFIPSLGVVCQCQDGSFPMSSGRCKQLPARDAGRSAASVAGPTQGRLPAATRPGDYGAWPGQSRQQDPALAEQRRRRQESLARRQKWEGWLANTNRILGHIVDMQRGGLPGMQGAPTAPAIPRPGWPPNIPQGSGGFQYPDYTSMQGGTGRQPATRNTTPGSPAIGSRSDAPVLPGLDGMMGQTTEQSNQHIKDGTIGGY
jgi:hypothetical protein